MEIESAAYKCAVEAGRVRKVDTVASEAGRELTAGGSGMSALPCAYAAGHVSDQFPVALAALENGHPVGVLVDQGQIAGTGRILLGLDDHAHLRACYVRLTVFAQIDAVNRLAGLHYAAGIEIIPVALILLPAGLHNAGAGIEEIFLLIDGLHALQGAFGLGNIPGALAEFPPAQSLQAVELEEELAAVYGIPLVIDVYTLVGEVVRTGRYGNGLLLTGLGIGISFCYSLGCLVPAFIGTVL